MAKRLIESGCCLEMVSGIGQGMGALDGGDDRRKGRAVLGSRVNLGRPIVTTGDFVE